MRTLRAPSYGEGSARPGVDPELLRLGADPVKGFGLRGFVEGETADRRTSPTVSGGWGISSNCVTLAAPWRLLVPTLSEPVSPPPMTITCLPSARNWPLTLSPALTLVLLRQELHREMNAVEVAAGHRQVARLLCAAGQQHGIEFFLQLLGRDGFLGPGS